MWSQFQKFSTLSCLLLLSSTALFQLSFAEHGDEESNSSSHSSPNGELQAKETDNASAQDVRTSPEVEIPKSTVEPGGGENMTELNKTKTLFELYKDMKALREWIEKPYVHGVILPAIIGVAAALITVSTVCCIHSCVRNTARRRRKVRIRNLADELKTDRALLLADDGSDEEF